MGIRTLKLFYENEANNFGDILNVDIFKALGFDVEYSSKRKSEIVAIGSLLDLYLCNKKQYIKRFRYKFYKPVIVWGTGFIKDENIDDVVLRYLDVYAVRGYNTLKRLKASKMVTLHDNVAIGDPGLLISKLYDTSKIKKKYALGIIRHYCDENHNSINNINVDNSIVINIRQNPETFIKQIAECECVVSSAMHGLICADSLGVPNMRLILSNKLIGGDYKFDDYYSAFDLQNHSRIDLNNQNIDNNTLQYIYDNYLISKSKIEIIQNNLLQSFPFDKIIHVKELCVDK